MLLLTDAQYRPNTTAWHGWIRNFEKCPVLHFAGSITLHLPIICLDVGTNWSGPRTNPWLQHNAVLLLSHDFPQQILWWKPCNILRLKLNKVSSSSLLYLQHTRHETQLYCICTVLALWLFLELNFCAGPYAVQYTFESTLSPSDLPAGAE